MQKIIFILLFLITSCSQPNEKAWIILELLLPDGYFKKIAFHNPRVPDATLDECKEALPMVTPELFEFIKSEACFAGAKLKNIECVVATGDPLDKSKP